LKDYRLTPCASTHNEGIKWLKSAVKGTSAAVRTKESGRTSVDDGPQPHSHARTKTIWSISRVIASPDSTVCVDTGAEDAQQVYREDKLGCARGAIWAAAFQISVIIAVAICWELYSLLR
jgi:hypothetical protein